LWSCSITSLANNYGQNCDFVISNTVTSNTNKIFINSPLQNSSYSYAVQLQVYTIDADGSKRFDAKTINIQVNDRILPDVEIFITSQKNKINANSKLSLKSILTSNQATKTNWQAYINEIPFDLSKSALTPLNQSFVERETINSIVSPLAVALLSSKDL
jgi:hypothetical protein